jgi:hypothetical protein
VNDREEELSEYVESVWPGTGCWFVPGPTDYPLAAMGLFTTPRLDEGKLTSGGGESWTGHVVAPCAGCNLG